MTMKQTLLTVVLLLGDIKMIRNCLYITTQSFTKKQIHCQRLPLVMYLPIL